MAAINSSLSSWNTGRHCSFGFKSYEVLGIKESRGIGSVIRDDPLGSCIEGPRGNEQSTIRAWFITRTPSLGPVLGASVPRTQSAPSSR
jgi:hypothetical protein